MRYIPAALAALFLSSTAMAGDFYASTFGGVNFDDVINVPFVSDNTGYVVGGAIGTHIKAVPGLRVEAEVSFRQNDVDIFSVLKASHETTAIMANAIYTLPLGTSPIRPYIMGGIGYGHSEVILESISLAKLESSGIAWQLGGGVETNVADGITVGIGYRYYQAEPIEVLSTQISDGSNHSIVAELRFAL